MLSDRFRAVNTDAERSAGCKNSCYRSALLENPGLDSLLHSDCNWIPGALLAVGQEGDERVQGWVPQQPVSQTPCYPPSRDKNHVLKGPEAPVCCRCGWDYQSSCFSKLHACLCSKGRFKCSDEDVWDSWECEPAKTSTFPSSSFSQRVEVLWNILSYGCLSPFMCTLDV